MKKTNRVKKKKNIFLKLIDLFDRLIITPITKLILIITDSFKSNGHGLEKVLTNRQALIIISLLCALITFFTIDNKFTTLVDNSAEVLYGQKVKAIYNEEAFVVEGLPETVDVTLIGRKWDVYLAKQYPADEVTVDLTGLSAGQHRVNLKYKQSVSSVDYKLDTSSVSIMIYEKVSETRELSYDIIHRDKLETKLNIETVTLNRGDVIIKGAEYKLKEVASVKALIDVENISKPKVGSITLTDIPLVAYDKDGGIIDVEIVPEKVEAVVKITSPSKVVPIKVIPEKTPEGKAIKSLIPSVKEVTIYGDEVALEEITYLPVTIDVSNVTTDKTYTINLTKPAGVRELSVKTITVDLKLDEITSKEIKDVQIAKLNLAPGLDVQALSKEDRAVSVIVKGSKSVLDALDEETVKAYIDLSGITEPGEYEVNVTVTGEDSKLTYTPRVKKVKVKVYKVQ